MKSFCRTGRPLHCQQHRNLALGQCGSDNIRSQASKTSADVVIYSYCACFVLNLIGLGPFYSSTTILAWYTDRKLLSSSEAALISSFYVFSALWDPLTAAVITKLGSRKSGCIGLGLAVIGTLASSFCTEKPKLLWLFFGVLTGWGAGGFLVLVSGKTSLCENFDQRTICR